MSEHEQDAGADRDEVEGVGKHAARAASERMQEKIEQEAAEAEAEPELEPEPDLSDPNVQIALAHQQYTAAIAEAMGADAEIKVCGHCGGMGFNPLEFPADPRRVRCDECDGWGMVERDTRVESQLRGTCEKCNGNGWVLALQAPEQPAQPQGMVPVLPAYVPPPSPPQRPVAAGSPCR